MAGWIDRARRLARLVREVAREHERGTGRTRTRPSPPTKRVDPGARVVVATGTATTVEYTPELDGDPDPGEVVWSWVPYDEDATRGKDRPVVIVGRTGDDLAGVPLTSKNSGRADHVAVGSGAWDPRSRPSFAKVDRLLTIDPDDVRREGAILARDRFDAVIAGLGRHHDLVRT